MGPRFWSSSPSCSLQLTPQCTAIRAATSVDPSHCSGGRSLPGLRPADGCSGSLPTEIRGLQGTILHLCKPSASWAPRHRALGRPRPSSESSSWHKLHSAGVTAVSVSPGNRKSLGQRILSADGTTAPCLRKSRADVAKTAEPSVSPRTGALLSLLRCSTCTSLMEPGSLIALSGSPRGTRLLALPGAGSCMWLFLQRNPAVGGGRSWPSKLLCASKSWALKGREEADRRATLPLPQLHLAPWALGQMCSEWRALALLY